MRDKILYKDLDNSSDLEEISREITLRKFDKAIKTTFT